MMSALLDLPFRHHRHVRLRTRAGVVAFVAAVALSIAVVFAFLPSPAYAEKADRDKPTQVESDRMQYDDLKQVNVFTGNVVLTKGTIRLYADRLVVRQDEQGYQFATATGDLARFRQRRDGPGDQYIEGQARQIDYDGKAETFRLQQQAMLRRTAGGRVMDEVHGSDILYEARSEFFTVEGKGEAGATPENPSGRVRVVIQPREDPASAPAAPAANPANATTLQPSERLDVPGEGGSR